MQLNLKGSFLTAKKLFPNKSPFIAVPVSSHTEALKHLGSGRCLLNVTGPSAVAFQYHELFLSLLRPALHFPFKIGFIYHHPLCLFPYLSREVWQEWCGRGSLPEGSSSDRGNTRRALAGNSLNMSPEGTQEADLII